MEGFLTLVAFYVIWHLIGNFFRNQKIKKLVKEMEEEKNKIHLNAKLRMILSI